MRTLSAVTIRVEVKIIILAATSFTKIKAPMAAEAEAAAAKVIAGLQMKKSSKLSKTTLQILKLLLMMTNQRPRNITRLTSSESPP